MRPGIWLPEQSRKINRNGNNERTHYNTFQQQQKKQQKNLFSLIPLSGSANYICSTFSTFFTSLFSLCRRWLACFLWHCQVALSSQPFVEMYFYFNVSCIKIRNFEYGKLADPLRNYQMCVCIVDYYMKQC